MMMMPFQKEFLWRMAGLVGNCPTLFIERQLSDAEHVMHAFTKNMGFIGFYSK